MKIRAFFLLLIGSIWLMISSCSSGSQNQDYDRGDPLSGYFTIATDPAYLPLVKVLAETYMGLYPLVAIKIDSSKTGNPYQWTVDSTIRMVVTGIDLSEKDSMALVNRGLVVKVSPIATDGLVMITSKSSDKDSSISFSLRHDSCFHITGLQFNNTMFTDKTVSENNYYLSRKISSSCNVNWNPVQTQESVIDSVALNKGSLGLVSWNYLCERKSSLVKSRLNKVEIIPITDSLSNRIYPTQSSVFTATYPMTRSVWMVTSEPFAGPATGFAAWVASSEGQRVIRLFGGAPMRIPPREIQISN
ncbi:MAG: substrate-binding domain-containing protein [Arcticibacter sp.]